MSLSTGEAVAAVGEIRQMPYGLARTQLAETLARRIDAEGPIEVLAYALFAQVESYVWSEEPDKAHVPFQRLLRLWDSSPEVFDETDRQNFFWAFKWMVGGLKSYPEIPASQIEATLADMERRYALAGNGMDAVAYCTFAWANHRRDPDVELAFDAWVATPRDDFSQCEACSLGDEAEYLWSTGRAEQAVRHILDVPPTTRWCATEPGDMLAVLALAQAELGRLREAATAHRRAAAALQTSESDMAEARGRGFQLLARGGQVERALEWLARDGHLLVGAETPLSRLHYQLAVLAGLADLPEPDLQRTVSLPDVPARTLGELRAWLEPRAHDLAARFDARNGTDRWAGELERALGRRRFAEPLDLAVIRLDADDDAVLLGGVAAGSDDADGLAGPLGAAGVVDGTNGGATGEVSGGAAGAVDASGAGAADPDGATEPAGYVDRLARAEAASGEGDLAAAAAAYLAGARGAQEAGELLDSGFAYAEAARCAQELGDEDGAHQAYEAAMVRLRAAGADPELMVQVIVAWAPAAARPDRAEVYLDAANALLERLAGVDLGEIPDERLRERRTRELSLRRAELDDALARVIASVGQIGVWGTKDAVDLAVRAAELLAECGDVPSAAHAFWAAGRMLRDATGDEELERAVFCLESAVEGFGLVKDRTNRGEAANELVALLRATGQDARAEEILGTL